MTMTAAEAIKNIQAEFPEITGLIQEDEGLLHLQIATFSHLVQAFIDSGNRENFARACVLFTTLYSQAAPDLENALNVSFLEHLEFSDGDHERRWAYSAMPESMRAAWDAMDEYIRNLK